jgi:hypothetical protein
MRRLRKASPSHALALVAMLSAFLLPNSCSNTGHQAATHAYASASSAVRRPLARALWPGAFETDDDQAATEIAFSAENGVYRAKVRSDGLSVAPPEAGGRSVNVSFVGATAERCGQLAHQRGSTVNFIGGTSRNRREVHRHRFGDVVFANVYPGIDAHYHVNAGQLELDFVVAPGASADVIAIQSDAGTVFRRDSTGCDIVATSAGATFRLRCPRAFQQLDSGTIEIPIDGELDGDRLGFRVGSYDHTQTLTIDPLVATYSTFVSGPLGGDDDAIALALDGAGNLYIAGQTSSEAFPNVPTAFDPIPSRAATSWGYVVKLSPTDEVIYGSFIYGLSVKALAVDSAGSPYITGSTLDSTDFPGTAGVFDNDPSGEVFVTKLTPDGSALAYSALFPGNAGNGVAVDASGNAYVVGEAAVPNLPTTPGSIKPSNPVLTEPDAHDGFLLKINPSGSALVFGTYLGGSGADSALAVSVNALGEATVVGQTSSSDFVGFTGTPTGTSDAFVIQVSADGSAITNGRLFGGTGDDYASAVAKDGSGGFVLCGVTTSTDFPTTAGAFQTRLLGHRNGWVRRIDSSLNTIFSTYFGGSAVDGCLGIAADSNANSYIVGVAFSSDMPTTTGAYQDATSQVSDSPLSGVGSAFYVTQTFYVDREAYFAELSADGTQLLYGTYLSGDLTDPFGNDVLSIASGVAVGQSGVVYASGATTATNFPSTGLGFLSEPAIGGSGFLFKFAPSGLFVTSPTVLPNEIVGQTYSYALAASGGSPPYTWKVVSDSLPYATTLSADGVISWPGTAQPGPSSPNIPGSQFSVQVADSLGAIAYKNLIINTLGNDGGVICYQAQCTARLPLGRTVGFTPPTLARGVGPFTLGVSTALPAGATIDSSTGVLTFVPTAEGVYVFGLVVSDSLGRSAPITLTVTVTPALVTPTASVTVSPDQVTTGQSVAISWTSTNASVCFASGGGADGSPWSGTIATSGSVSQTASVVGSYVYTVACNGPGGSTGEVGASVVVSVPSAGGGTGGKSGGGGGSGVFDLTLLVLLLGIRRAFEYVRADRLVVRLELRPEWRK